MDMKKQTRAARILARLRKIAIENQKYYNSIGCNSPYDTGGLDAYTRWQEAKRILRVLSGVR